MKTKFGIVGCGFLGNIVANAWKNGLLEDYELVGVTSRSPESAQKAAEAVGCTVCADVGALLALDPEYIVETASVEAVREMAIPVLKRGVNLVVISIGAFADLAFYEQVRQAAREGGAKVHLASGAIGGFDVLQTVSLMAQAQNLPETAGIETHTGARGFRNTPVWAEHLLTDTEKTTVFTGNAKEAIAHLPPPRKRRRRHVAGDHRAGRHRRDDALRAQLGRRRPPHYGRNRRRKSNRGYLLKHKRDCRLERCGAAAQPRLSGRFLLMGGQAHV